MMLCDAHMASGVTVALSQNRPEEGTPRRPMNRPRNINYKRNIAQDCIQDGVSIKET